MTPSDERERERPSQNEMNPTSFTNVSIKKNMPNVLRKNMPIKYGQMSK